jgi:hypothetical protein
VDERTAAVMPLGQLTGPARPHERLGLLPFLVALEALMRSSDDVLEGVDFGLVDQLARVKRLDAHKTRKGNRQLR